MLASRKSLQGFLFPLGVTALLWLFFFTLGPSWLGELPATRAPSGGVGGIFYYLLKGSILWVPLGFIFAIAGRAVTLQRWALSGAVSFLIIAMLSGAARGLWDYMEAVIALIGIWGGLWIGGHMGEEPSETEQRPVETPAMPVSIPYQASWLRFLGVFVLLGLLSWAVWDFSRWQVALGTGLFIYFITLLRFRYAWLFAIPMLLPALNLAPWTGRLSLDEFDLLMIVTIAGALYHGIHPDNRPLAPRPIALLLGGYAFACIAAFFIGLFPFPGLDINSFDNYFSQFNSWNVGKGFLWGFFFLGLVRWTLPAGSRFMERLFVPGLLTGLLIVALIGLRERWQFADLMDFSIPYRITATFSTMHTGGAHLDAYLALLVPFIGYWVIRSGRPLALLGGLVLFFAAVYLVISTVTRTTLVVLIVEMALITLFWLKGFSRSGGRKLSALIGGLLILAIAGPLLYLGMQGGFLQKRLTTVERDASVRLSHWSSAVGMMDEGVFDQVLGMGFGRFPAIYLERHRGVTVPGTYRFEKEQDNHFLRLHPGETLYLAQKVPVHDRQRYRLALDVRSRKPDARITVPVCEKHLLNSKRCQWLSYRLDAGVDRQWLHRMFEFDSEDIGEGNWLSRRPVELFLYNPNKNAVIDVDNVSLIDTRGSELLNNGSFSKGSDYWFFKTHQHLPWHIKNLWVSSLFEQGWLGVSLFSLLILALVMYLAGPAWYSAHPAAAAVTVALVGFGATGVFASPFDAPRITMLFFMVVSFGLYEASSGSVFRATGTKNRGSPSSRYPN